MNVARGLRAAVQGNPTTMRRLHGWLTVAWFLAAAPICVFFAESVPFLVFVSVYAVVTGHWASWQAARVEENQMAQEAR